MLNEKQSKKSGKFAKDIRDVAIVDEMSTSYIDYAMSVIVSRALPDVRDGLKPVHRRILFTMKEAGLVPQGRFRKSATVVGSVLGRYHPHGDVAVYDSLVRLAQPFSMRYPLINGQGNFGSIDGDTAAAMRYTETKLKPISEAMLADIDKDTVDFMDNYDGTRKEPKVLAARLPNLLINGTLGIAVGMATAIPPHNLSEVCDAIAYLIDHPDAEVEDLLKFIKGPDLPTGGLIYDFEELKAMYASGKGRVIMRAKANIEEGKNGRFRIIITEIPYQVNKSLLLQKIALVVKDKKIKGISDLRDESGKAGIKIVIELKRDAHPKKILNQLFKYTQMQDTLYANMLALDNGIQPRVFNLKSMLLAFIEHRKVVVIRRTKFELKKAQSRKHILEGFLIALDHLDEVIKTIRSSANREVAAKNLVKKFKLSVLQAEAILEMRLHQLSALERKQVLDEYEEIKKLIVALQELLGSEKKIYGVIKKETTEISEKFGDSRRTKIIKQKIGEMGLEDLVANEPNLVAITRDNYIKRMPVNTYRSQGRGGKGVLGMSTKAEDEVAKIFVAMTHERLLFFTDQGRVLQALVYDLPEATRQGRGAPLVNFIELRSNEKVTAVVNLSNQSDYKYMFMATKHGLVKKIDIKDLANVRKSGIIIIHLKNEDELLWAKPTMGDDEIILVSELGQSIRFKESDARPMGRAAAGVRGIKLKDEDELVGMDVISFSGQNSKELEDMREAMKAQGLNEEDLEEILKDSAQATADLLLMTVSKMGYGKLSALKQFKVQNRGGSGVKAAKVTRKTGNLVVARLVIQDKKTELIIISRKGQMIKIPLKSVRALSRVTQGAKLMRLKVDDEIASVAVS